MLLDFIYSYCALFQAMALPFSLGARRRLWEYATEAEVPMRAGMRCRGGRAGTSFTIRKRCNINKSRKVVSAATAIVEAAEEVYEHDLLMHSFVSRTNALIYLRR